MNKKNSATFPCFYIDEAPSSDDQKLKLRKSDEIPWENREPKHAWKCSKLLQMHIRR